MALGGAGEDGVTIPESLLISADGSFELGGHAFRIPEEFTPRQILGYRSLLVPVPDKRWGTVLTAEQRLATDAYLHRRAADCVIPGFGFQAPASVTPAQLKSIHEWIGRHRSALSGIEPPVGMRSGRG